MTKDEAAKRRWWFILVALLFALNIALGQKYIWAHEEMWSGMQNGDTRSIIAKFTRDHNYLQYLTSDWALMNNFYRPLPTYAFLLDYYLYRGDIHMYKWFDVVNCSLVAVVVAFLLRALTESRRLAISCALLFTAWQTDILLNVPLVGIFHSLSAAFFVSVLILSPKHWKIALLAGLAIWYLGDELIFDAARYDRESQTFGYRTMGWPPGRTATIFTLFGLSSLLCYIRYIKTGAFKFEIGVLIFLVLSLMSYEQAVTLPAALIITAFYLRAQKYKVSFAWLGFPIALVAAYWYWHTKEFPIGNSVYQQQRLKSKESGVDELLGFIFPASRFNRPLKDMFNPAMIPWFVFNQSYWDALMDTVANISIFLILKRYWKIGAMSYLICVVAYIPMAFVSPLVHYMYFSAPFRAIFVAALVFAIRDYAAPAYDAIQAKLRAKVKFLQPLPKPIQPAYAGDSDASSRDMSNL
ncbi:MAG: hypothetical protein JSS72_02110 [Armatimonadetes bacterium]|nr:hypothetical protein [Armatimonadota bacterium]